MGTKASIGKQGKATGAKGNFGSGSYFERRTKRRIVRAEAERAAKARRKQAAANAKRRATLAKKKKAKLEAEKKAAIEAQETITSTKVVDQPLP